MTTETARIVDFRPLTLVGLDRQFTFAQIPEIPSLWVEFYPFLDSIPNRVERVTYGVSYAMGAAGFRYMCAFEVTDASDLPKGIEAKEVPPQRYAVFQHEGDLSTLGQSIDSIWNQWLPQSGKSIAEPPMMMERYGPGFSPDTRSGDIELWLAIKD